MDKDCIPKVALEWTPAGKKKPRRPKITWRRTVLTEFNKMDLTRSMAQHFTQDRASWKEIVFALFQATKRISYILPMDKDIKPKNLTLDSFI